MALMGSPGEIALTIQITRAATGQVEEVQLIGRIGEDDDQPPTPDPNAQD